MLKQFRITNDIYNNWKNLGDKLTYFRGRVEANLFFRRFLQQASTVPASTVPDGTMTAGAMAGTTMLCLLAQWRARRTGTQTEYAGRSRLISPLESQVTGQL